MRSFSCGSTKVLVAVNMVAVLATIVILQGATRQLMAQSACGWKVNSQICPVGMDGCTSNPNPEPPPAVICSGTVEVAAPKGNFGKQGGAENEQVVNDGQLLCYTKYSDNPLNGQRGCIENAAGTGCVSNPLASTTQHNEPIFKTVACP